MNFRGLGELIIIIVPKVKIYIALLMAVGTVWMV